jgi:hypothetical protein
MFEDINKFEEFVRIAIYGAGTPTITAGNVDFWIDDDVLCFSIPTSRWNTETIHRDLGEMVKIGVERMRKALS